MTYPHHNEDVWGSGFKKRSYRHESADFLITIISYNTVMITLHQPTIFGNEIIAVVSSAKNGPMTRMARQAGVGEAEIDENRAKFLLQKSIKPEQATIVLVDYDTNDFARYREAAPSEKGNLHNPQPADALVTTQPGHALFLPLADCVGVVLYDPASRALMVSHLGRQATEIHGATKSVQYLANNYGVKPENVRVWLSPAVGKATYPLHKFDNMSLHEVNYKHLTDAGVLPEHIEITDVDTAMDDNYYSHSQFLKGRAEKQGRHAIVAMIAQGEPAF